MLPQHVAAIGHHIADSTFGIGQVSVGAGYDVDVGVEDGLPCGFAGVRANVETVYGLGAAQQIAHYVDDSR